ncbi:MAG: trehalose-phosphatase [Alphaproteobacteria bacterium]|nr:trehalose-phosphatase [Alphaproteobacteria bacterium]
MTGMITTKPTCPLPGPAPDLSVTALFLDFDGTITDLVPDPAKVRVPGNVHEDLRALIAAGFPVAIITGRALGAIDSFLPGLQPAGAGCHGAELRETAGAAITHMVPSPPEKLVAMATKAALEFGCFFEHKPFALALHGITPHNSGQVAERLSELTAADAGNGDYVVKKIGPSYEIIHKNVSKGLAIGHFMQLPAFAKRVPIYIGDDVGEEPSMDTVGAWGGRQIGVTAPTIVPGDPRHNDPRYLLDGPADLHAFLAWVVQSIT